MAKIHKLTKDGQVIYPATTTDAVVHPDLKVPVSRLFEEVNVSKLYPTGGTDGTDKYTLETAIAKIPTSLRNAGLKCSFLDGEGKPETWEYRGGTFTAASSWAETGAGTVADLKERVESLGKGTGSGSGFYNVTVEQPPGSGYYTKETAVAALSGAEIDDDDKPGMIITFEASAGKWSDYRFTGTSIDSFLTPGAWEEYGGAGAVKRIVLNGEEKSPDPEGTVNLNLDQVEVDETLDPDSTNAVQNAAVAAKISEIEAATLFGSEVSENDDNTVTVSLRSKSATITEFTIPAGGGGDGTGAGTRIVLSASVDNPVVKEGGTAKLTWSYNHCYGNGAGTGQRARVTVQVKRGTTVAYESVTQDVGQGTYTLDLTSFLLAGTSDIYVVAETTDPDSGQAQRKQAYTSVKVVTLSLSSSYNIASGLSAGGYGSGESVQIPYAVSGNGTKVVTLYVDGVQADAHTVTRSGTTNSGFTVALSGLAAGRHTVQLVAEMDAGGGVVLKSESIHIDLLKSGEGAPFVGLMITHKDGRIAGAATHLTPVVEVGQYEQCEFKFAAYDPDTTPASVEIRRNGTLLQTVSVPRTAQTYQNRFTEQGRQTLQLKVGGTAYTLYIDVEESGIDIGEATYGLQVKLSPAGRSNDEGDPAIWESGTVRTTFEGFDWRSSGWTGDSLLLTNGAKAVIGCKLFEEDAGADGATIEVEFKVDNVLDRAAEVIGCMSGGKGLSITAEEASIKTGTILHYTNEDGEDASREVKIGTKFAPGLWLKVAFVIGKRSEGRLMELYVNGNRAGADIYDNNYYFRQEMPVGLTLDGGMADLEVRTIRVYNRALTDDEVLENRMVDAGSTDDMMRLYEENDILGDTGDVSLDKLRTRGKGVMRIVRPNKLDDVYAENNKSTDFKADVYFYSPFGKEHDFVLQDCNIRIQGTSSTKYPSKNIRVYFAKGGDSLSLTVNGEPDPLGGNKYRMRPGAIPMNLFTMKSDYSDSSMSLNTGGAKLYNEVMKELGLLTPPQRHQYGQGGSLNAVTVRSAIDGFPIDIFCAETVEGENTYYGQYNFNNEKSKSQDLFGMTGVEGFTPALPMTFETLNNGAAMCLFRTESDTQVEAEFDAGLETNYPDDVKWAGLSEAQRAAVKRLYAWIRSCVPAGASSSDLSTFASQKFKDEASRYFDVPHLLTYYIDRDYNAGVDQLAKNILLRTWDGMVWYLTYYDGDTQLGKRNDCFLAYDYTVDRDTWDAEAGKYAFEGHDSWLWNLVLANLQSELRECAANYRSKMTVERALAMFSDEQAGNWSDRAYNKSGYLKYIRPSMEEVYGKKWPFIYALQGSNEAHREYFIRNRFALLDAKYGTGGFTSDNIDLYLSRAAGDAADVVKVTANEVYAFGYGTNNSPNIANTGIVQEGAVASLDITGAYTVNDPLRIYGASRVRVLDMTGAAGHLKNSFDLGKCTVLRELTLETAAGGGSTGWWLNIGGCRQLQKVNLRNQTQAKTGSSTSTELDLTNQTRLEELDARGTQVQSVAFAKGAPLTSAKLPGTLTVLKLEYLGKLTAAGLTLESYASVKTLVVDGCPGLDWEALLARCANVERLRVTGIDREDDGTWLDRFRTMGGVDAEGNATSTCALVGTVRMTRYLEDGEYQAARAHFPELNIVQPEYSMLEFDDTVADDANASNLDNGTGYKFGNRFVASGHAATILNRRHRVLAKVTKMATTRAVTMAGVETTMNNPDGEMAYYPLDDADSYKYADGTAAKLDGTEGDWMMYEPFFWSKGVNDCLNGKHYSCYSSNDREHMPATPEATVLTLDDLKATDGGYLAGRRIVTGHATLTESYETYSGSSVCKVAVRGYSRVRFPTVANDVYELGTVVTIDAGSVFTDDAGTVVGSVSIPGDRFQAGMYLIADVPSGATALYFTIQNNVEFDKVVLSNSGKIEDMEPDWVANDEHLCAVAEGSVVDNRLRSCITSGASKGNLSWTNFHNYAALRGMQLIDMMMHSRIANLFYARYGRRDCQEQCGAGDNMYSRTVGETASCGMTDTIGYEEASSIDANVTNKSFNSAHAYAWYRNKDGLSVTQVNSICCLGYENIFGCKYELVDGADMPNNSGYLYRWRIWMPDGTVRHVMGKERDSYIKAVVHGKYMDMIPVGNGVGSSSTYYCDLFSRADKADQVIARSGWIEAADAGISMIQASCASTYTSNFIGSRLAFRGKLVKAASVAAYKAITALFPSSGLPDSGNTGGNTGGSTGGNPLG